MNKILLFFLGWLCISSPPLKADSTPAPGPIKIWQYEPIDRSFWQLAIEKIDKKYFTDALEMAEVQIKKSKKESLVLSEAQLIQALALHGLNLDYAATKIASQLIKSNPSTNFALRALLVIEDIVKFNPVDEDEVFGELIWDQDDQSEDAPVADFLNYINSQQSLIRGYPAWSEKQVKKITAGSYWDFKVKYNEALQDVKKNKIDFALEKFANLASHPSAPEDLKMDASHQYARLLFEKKEYDQAYKVYKQVQLNPRERGLILLERAWTRYYEKNYSKALGLLTALEAPAFDTARTPETYILKMLIYKELCYYRAISQVQKEYKKRFSKSIDAIKGRRDLKKDQVIVQLSALDRHIGRWVNLLNRIKSEKADFNKLSSSEFSKTKDFKVIYDLKIKELYEKLEWMLKDKSREIAKNIVDWDEQISFLDYQARVDALRVSKTLGEKDYKTEEVPHMTFDRIFWVFKGEYWLDEIEKLKVLVNSKCSRSPASARGKN